MKLQNSTAPGPHPHPLLDNPNALMTNVPDRVKNTELGNILLVVEGFQRSENESFAPTPVNSEF